MATYHSRSIAKAMSWRIVATLTTFTIVYILTGELTLSLEVGVFDATLKMLFYYLHERGWGKISWGQLRHPLSKIAVKKELSDEDMDIVRQKLKDLGYMWEFNTFFQCQETSIQDGFNTFEHIPQQLSNQSSLYCYTMEPKIIVQISAEDKRGFVVKPFEGEKPDDIYNTHLVSLNPGAVRGNHFHPTQTE